MFRKTLQAATALVLCASISFAVPKTGQSSVRNPPRDGKPVVPIRLGHRVPAVVAIGHEGAGPIRNNVSHWVPGAVFNNFSKDKNAEFMSWYGFEAINSTYSDFGISISEIGNNAIPIFGTGKKVTKILVPITSLTGSQTEFNVGIYSATPSGLPGKLELVGGSTTASDTEYCCTGVRSVDVDIKLKAGEKYFIEVSCPQTGCDGAWNIEDTDYSGNTQDYFHFRYREGRLSATCTGSPSNCSVVTYSSPWHLSTYYPVQPAAIVK